MGDRDYNSSLLYGASLVAQTVKCLPAMRDTWVQYLGWEDPLEKEMATHSSTLAQKIPQMEEPSRLQSMGSQKLDTTERLYFLSSWQVDGETVADLILGGSKITADGDCSHEIKRRVLLGSMVSWQ